jgi:hypothetical protein
MPALFMCMHICTAKALQGWLEGAARFGYWTCGLEDGVCVPAGRLFCVVVVVV